jgi:anaerobic selenocysteine-containing dehydrogenase
MAGFETASEEFPQEVYPKDQPRPVGAVRFPLWDEVVGEMQGNDLARQIRQGLPYPVKAVWAHGMNFRMFNGDLELEQALKELDFFVDIDLFLTDTAKLADIVLPCCSSFERSEFKVYGGGLGQWTQKVIEPLGQSMRDDEICCELARRLDLDDEMLKSGPETCIRYMLRNTPIDVDYLKAHPESPQKLDGVEMIPVGHHTFQTPSGKFELWSKVIEKYPMLDPLPTYRDSVDGADPEKYPFRLVTGARLPNALHSRLHDVPWARSLRPEAMADLNDEDAKALGLVRGDKIQLETTAGSITVAVNPTMRVKRGTVHMYHGYREADVNSIIPPGHNDPYSGFPGYRSVRCNVRPVKEMDT